MSEINQAYLDLLRPIPAELRMPAHVQGPAPNGGSEQVAKEVPKEVLVYDGVTTPYVVGEASTPFAAWKTDDLIALDRRVDVLEAVARFAGLPTAEGERGVWSVGGCDLSLRVWLDENDRFVYLVTGLPKEFERKSLCLPEVYAIALTGRVRRFGKPELLHFRSMLSVDLGFVQPVATHLPRLPSIAPSAPLRLWAEIPRFLSHRNVARLPGEPFPLVAPWFAAAYQLDEGIVRSGRRWLERQGYLRRSGTAPGLFGRDTILWSAKDASANEAEVIAACMTFVYDGHGTWEEFAL